MSDRLNELQRQRALVQEQLAWLEREIARESGGQPLAAPAPAPVVIPALAPAAVAPVPPTPAVPKDFNAEADRILAQYRTAGRSPQDEIKRGCIIYFLGAMTLLCVGLTALMLWKYW